MKIKINHLFIAFIPITLSCEFIEVKPKINKSELEEILLKKSEFNDFISSHFQNILVINSLSDLDSLELIHLQKNIESYKIIERSSLFFDKIGFNLQALEHLNIALKFLRESYTFKEDDLSEIIDYHVTLKWNQKVTSSGKANILYFPIIITCDTYCTLASEAAYPSSNDANSIDGTMNATSRRVYCAGCMNGCKWASN